MTRNTSESRRGALPRRAGREKALALEAWLAALNRRNLELGRELCALRTERLRRADAAAAAEAADLVKEGKILPACAPYVKALLAAGDDVPVWLDGRLTSAAALLREILEAMPPYERGADSFPEKINNNEALGEDAGGSEMTVLTANYDAERKDGILVAYKVAARTVIYKGAMVCLNRGGYAVPAADEPALTFVGVAYERGDNAAGDDGDVSARVWKDGSFRVAMSSPTLEDLGAAAYVVDDNAVALSSANSVLAGTVVEVPAQGVVRILIRNAVK
jgi:hypothetical protein